MKTTTFADILNGAMECAGRSRDKQAPQEQVMLQHYLATEFQNLWPARAWPELTPPMTEVMAANWQFSKNEGQDAEMGDLLDVMLRNPQASESRRRDPGHVGFYEGDGVVWVDTPRTNLWVEYMLPYPSKAWPDLNGLALAAFLAAPCPLRFRNILMHKGAGHLLAGDGNAAGAGVQYGLAEKCLATEILRLPPEPWWRNTMRLIAPGR